MRPLSLLAVTLAVLAPSAAIAQAAQTPTCVELPWKQWPLSSSLVVHEATTCAWVVGWEGWAPERKAAYVPDGQGWISDYFIFGAHGQVFWNLRTNAVVVRPRSHALPLDESGARQVASWAKQSIFPGAELTKLRFNPTPCPDQGACTP
jgi:hypothetical protein